MACPPWQGLPLQDPVLQPQAATRSTRDIQLTLTWVLGLWRRRGAGLRGEDGNGSTHMKTHTCTHMNTHKHDPHICMHT